MTLDYVANLRNELPELFDDRPLPSNWDENWLAIPFDDEVEEILNPPDDHDDFQDYREIPQHPEIANIFPTFTKTNFGQKVGDKKVPADLLAFYLPFHLFPDDWGIYILASGVRYLARIIRLQSKLGQADALLVSRLFLYYHELYHHKVEMFVTRLEVPHRQPIYKTRKLFQKQGPQPQPFINFTEEALANADALMSTVNQLEAISQKGGYPKIDPAIVEPILAEFIRQNPPGYDQALNYARPHLFNFKQCTLAEKIQSAAFPASKGTAEPRIWSLFFNDVNDEKSYGVNERVFIVFDINSLLVRSNPLLPLCKPKKLKKVLETIGCSFHRNGKGSHEIWQCENGRKVTIPVHPGKDIPTGTVKSILEAATGMKLSETEIKELLHELG